MWTKDIGIDLGTHSVLVYIKGKGVVLQEPSIVAIETETKKVRAVGEEAYRMIGRTPENIIAIRPLKDGVIADFEITETMLKYFIDRIGVKTFFRKPRILICAPTGITSVEQKAIREAAEKAGGGEIFLEEEPKLAAIGAGLDIYKPSGNMVIDIGGGTTDIAVLSMGGVVTAASIKMAGDKFDQAIAQYIKHKYNLLIGERTSEEIKMKVGTACKEARNESIEIRGRDLVSGLPRSLIFTSYEAFEALQNSINTIVQAAKGVLEKTPPELASDIIDRGIVLTGGGSLLHGLDLLLQKELKVPVVVAEDPLTCVVRGTAEMLNNINNLQKKSIKTR